MAIQGADRLHEGDVCGGAGNGGQVIAKMQQYKGGEDTGRQAVQLAYAHMHS